MRGGRVEFVEANLQDLRNAEAAFRDAFVVFHLAADHGGRGYVDLHQAACPSNLLLDAVVFQACHRLGVHRVVYASSGCVYPNYLQSDVTPQLTSAKTWPARPTTPTICTAGQS